MKSCVKWVAKDSVDQDITLVARLAESKHGLLVGTPAEACSIEVHAYSRTEHLAPLNREFLED